MRDRDSVQFFKKMAENLHVGKAASVTGLRHGVASSESEGARKTIAEGRGRSKPLPHRRLRERTSSYDVTNFWSLFSTKRVNRTTQRNVPFF